MLSWIPIGLGGMLALAGAALAIALRDPIYAVLALVKSMLGLALVYFGLGADYFGAIQIIVYAGAILVLFLFVVMLVNLTPSDIPPLPRGLPLYGAIFLALLWMGLLSWGLRAFGRALPPRAAEAVGVPYLYQNLKAIGKVLLTAYALPFEVLSLTLLVGLIGATLLTQKRPKS
ncbi:MAG: NADH-quinone oxidoreductase subunit J [Bacteroidia bacterium]|nr:NADH-quinone oxidoreductase subunit J [Bacteroidia bacterium]MDW8088642.1 NADH-quinone oxidoreductase subunit J [Bacteroidia bacterium]